MYEEVDQMGDKAGKVLDIAGKRLMYKRRTISGQVGTFQAYVGMPFYMNDHFITDASTSATLEFLIGGKAGISPAREIVITGKRDIEIVGNQMFLKASRVWQKIDKLSSRRQVLGGGSIEG